MRISATSIIVTAGLALLICLSTACTTMRPITADASGEKVRQELKAGDTVHVLTKSGANHSFNVTEIGATSLVGKTVRMIGVGSPDTWGSPIEIPYADIAQIEVRRVEGLKTAILVAVLAVAADASINSARGSKHCCISSR
jgi:hypothetical protein